MRISDWSSDVCSSDLYVVEFLLGRYCATTDETEIQEGLDIVQRQLSSRTVKAGEEELFKARAREAGSVKIIDIITPAGFENRLLCGYIAQQIGRESCRERLWQYG